MAVDDVDELSELLVQVLLVTVVPLVALVVLRVVVLVALVLLRGVLVVPVELVRLVLMLPLELPPSQLSCSQPVSDQSHPSPAIMP